MMESSTGLYHIFINKKISKNREKAYFEIISANQSDIDFVKDLVKNSINPELRIYYLVPQLIYKEPNVIWYSKTD